MILNSALEIAQSIDNGTRDSEFTEEKSMWFATNATSTTEFNTNQAAIFSLYQTVEPFVRAIIGKQNSSLSGLSTFISASG